MAIQYEIEDGILVLRTARDGFTMLRDALSAATADKAAEPRMPLLIDVRDEPPGVRYEDVRWRVQILSLMRDRFAARWAILTETGPVRVGVGRMFAVFSEMEGVDVGLFADKDAATAWLRGDA